MTRPLRPATAAHLFSARQALRCLRCARDYLKAADSPEALEATRRAIKSAEGAVRHAERRQRAAHLGE